MGPIPSTNMATSTFMGQTLTSKAAASKSGKAVKGWGGGDAVYNLEKWYGPDRKLYLPGGLLEPADVPAYLDGELAGDYGYDPLGLGKDPEQVAAYRKNELLHARWAMLATIGCIVPEAANAFGDGTQITGAVWWQTGAAMLDGGLLQWYGITVPLPLIVVAAAEVALMGPVENYRAKNDG